MNLLAFLDSKVWAIEARALNSLRMKVATESPDMSKITTDFEERKAQLAKAPIGSGVRTRLKTGAIGENGVAIINISGPIFNVEGYFDEIIAFYLGGTSYQALQADIETIANDGQVKSWGAYVHSPGGEAFGMNETANKISALSKQKPSIGYAYGLACSAAFGLISSTGKVYADASAWIGSVGVVTQWADFTGFYEKLGIAYEEVTSTNAPFKRLDIRKPEHRAILMQEIDGVENEFVKLLAKNFDISVDKIRSDFGKGAVMTAKPAKAAGMIHEIGSWANVLKELQNIARKANNTNALGAENEGEPTMSSKKGLLEKFTNWLNSDDVKPHLEENGGEPATENPATPPKTETPATPPEASAANQLNAETELAKIKAERAEEKRQQVQKDAETFVTAEISAGRMFPAEKEGFLATLLQAAKDDDSSPLETGSRLETIKANQSARPKHGLTEEVLEPENGFKVLVNEQSIDAKLEKDIDDQTSNYVATVNPKPKLEAVK